MAVNISKPFGLQPIGHLDGSVWNGMTEYRLFDGSNAVFVGDPVVSGGTAGAAGVTVNGIDCEGLPNADRAAAGNTLLGVVVGFLPLQSDLSVLYKVANSTKRIGLVVTAPDVVYEIMEDSVGNDLAVTQVGNNFDMITWTAGNTTTGISAIMLDSSDTSGTATAQFRVLSLIKTGSDNVIGSYARWRVMINEHEFKTTTGV